MATRKPKSEKIPHTGRRPAKRVPRKPTPERLANIALHHLERFATSAEHLRHVLERRVLKASYVRDDVDVDEAKGWIDDLIKRYVDAGLLNDRAYAEGRARTLLAQGNAERLIRMKLMQKGVDADDIDAALAALGDEHTDPEFAAAVKLARRRRLGPYADPAKREDMREKHLAALARAGFSYDMAREVIDAEDALELEDRLAPPPFGG